MKKSLIILGCMIVGGILGFSATQSDIDFITDPSGFTVRLSARLSY